MTCGCVLMRWVFVCCLVTGPFSFPGLQETALNPSTAAVNAESVSTSLAVTEEGTGDGEEGISFARNWYDYD